MITPVNDNQIVDMNQLIELVTLNTCILEAAHDIIKLQQEQLTELHERVYALESRKN